MVGVQGLVGRAGEYIGHQTYFSAKTKGLNLDPTFLLFGHIEARGPHSRRFGKLIKENVQAGGDRQSEKALLRDGTMLGRLPPGVSRIQPHRYQQAASVPNTV